MSQEGAADVLREGEVRVPVAAVEIVVEDAADAARLVAVLEEEIFVAPGLVFLVGRDRRDARRRPPSSRRGRRCVSGSSWVRRRSSTGVRSAPPPNQALRGDDEARVHVHGRHVRIVRMRDQRDARGPEARIVVGAGNLLAEFRRELAVHGRAVHADLFEHAAVHHRHHAAAARLRRYDRCAARACARSGRPGDRPSGAPAGSSSSSASKAAQMSSRSARTRRARAVLAGVERRGVGEGAGHGARSYSWRKPPVCRSASPSAMAAAIATLSERKPGRIGIDSRASAASCTASGTPADSRPNSRMSPAR